MRSVLPEKVSPAPWRKSLPEIRNPERLWIRCFLLALSQHVHYHRAAYFRSRIFVSFLGFPDGGKNKSDNNQKGHHKDSQNCFFLFISVSFTF